MLPSEILKSFHMFRDVPPADLAVVAAHAERGYYHPNQLVFREGDDAAALYLVDVGTIELFRLTPELTILEVVGSGGRFGDIAFFNGGARAVSARAREASHVISIPGPVLRRLLQRRPDFAAAFYRNACESLARQLWQSFDDLSFARQFAAA
jgi:CRP/FNR family cyclic AMP-dependent transcriptional regulator